MKYLEAFTDIIDARKNMFIDISDKHGPQKRLRVIGERTELSSG